MGHNSKMIPGIALSEVTLMKYEIPVWKKPGMAKYPNKITTLMIKFLATLLERKRNWEIKKQTIFIMGPADATTATSAGCPAA